MAKSPCLRRIAGLLFHPLSILAILRTLTGLQLAVYSRLFVYKFIQEQTCCDR